MRQGGARKRVRNGNAPSTANGNDASERLPEEQATTPTFTFRRFLRFQCQWCLRKRLIGWIIVVCVFSCLVLWIQTIDQAATDHSSKLKSFPMTIRFSHDDASRTRRLDPNMEVYPSKRVIYVSERAIEAQEELENSKEYDRKQAEELETEDCKAQYEWQLTSFPTCNEVHATDLTNIHATSRKSEQVRLIAWGYYRDVWTVRNDGSQEKQILKTLRYSHDFAPRNYDRHRRDALAMERLTKAPHILDIYAYCGNSGLFEFANGGDLVRLLWPSRGSEYRNITQAEKLNVAVQITSAIAEVHNIDKEGRASMAHTDISPGQFVQVSKGRYRLNDFNRARFLSWSRERDEPCGYYVGSNPGKNRSPEEYRYEKQSEKVDVYSLGNIFFVLLTRKWPWDRMEEKRTKKAVKEGRRPWLPKAIRKSRDPIDIALIEAMNMSQRQDQIERASARQIETYLKEQLLKLDPIK